MCGIFGYYTYNQPKTTNDVALMLINGLQRLEYRGYDSAGLAIDSPGYPSCDMPDDMNIPDPTPKAAVAPNADHPIVTIKTTGKVSVLRNEALSRLSLLESKSPMDPDVPKLHNSGIAHTRWATHGPPTAQNAHPHVSSEQGEFVVVHNGIITNYKVLKALLEEHGETFETQTDTEVIPKLLKFLFDSSLKNGSGAPSLERLVLTAMDQLEGAFALLVKSKYYPQQLVACKRGSPLILGVDYCATGGGLDGCIDGVNSSLERVRQPQRRKTLQCFLASDASAIVEHTNKVIVLEDGDVVSLSRGEFNIYNLAKVTSPTSPLSPTKRVLETLKMEVAQIQKGGYDHFMQKEIMEQPESLSLTLSGRISTGSKDNPDQHGKYVKLGGLVDHLQDIRKSGRMIFVACGTSYHACIAVRNTLEHLVGCPVCLEIASDFLDRNCPIFRDDTCIFVSQSGETTDTLRALERAKACGALTVGIVNSVGSAICRASDCGIHINAGAEIGVASTKAYTSQIVAITLMALALSEDSKQKQAVRDSIIQSLGELQARVRTTLALNKEMRALAEKLKDESSLLVFGRGYNYSTALEAALKIKEVALIHSEGIMAGEMKHGPLALVDEKLAIIVIATKDDAHGKMVSVIQQLTARGATLIVVCNEDDHDMDEMANDCVLIRVPFVAPALQPVVNIIPLQLLSYHLTVLRGHDVDQPRNLAKSVTVTED